MTDQQKRKQAIRARLAKALGYQYHTGEIRSVEEARRIYRAVQGIAEASTVAQ